MFVAGKKRKAPAKGWQAAGGSSRLCTGAAKGLAAEAGGGGLRAAEAEISRWFLLGKENAREHQHRKALDYYNRAMALAANEGIKLPRLYEARSHALYKLGEFGRAMDDAKEAVSIDGSSAAGFSQMAAILVTLGQLQSALDVVDRGLGTVGQGAEGRAHLETQRLSLMHQLDPTYVPAGDPRTDLVLRLPEELAVLALRQLDTRMLMVCRGVAKHWAALVDSTPILWSRPSFHTPDPAQVLELGLPAYMKTHRMRSRRPEVRVPDRILRHVFEKSRGSLVSMCIPNGTAVTPATLKALFTHRRPCLRSIAIGGTAPLDAITLGRVFTWCLAPQITEIRLPYRSLIGNDAMDAIARQVPQLRVLDISGCINVRIKQLFKAWNAVLADAQGSTMLEELYINDHPGVPELIVYSMRYHHFRSLRVLHMAISDQSVFSAYTGLGPVLERLRHIPNAHVPFPGLAELNIDGVWNATISTQRFESSSIALLMARSRLLCPGLQCLSALDSAAASGSPLYGALVECFPSLRKLHLTHATNLTTQMVLTLTSVHQALPLVSLDLSNCAGVGSQALAALVGSCRDLVHVNLSQTAADNTVLARLTETISTDLAPRLEVLALCATNITGAAVRDFASACAKQYCRMRSKKGLGRDWRLQLLDIDSCPGVGCDAVAVTRDLLSFMLTRVLAAMPG
ncbi:hypothetical protein GGF46_004940 [Coemansia sp. RSA 552]|nr:hypothetical protein GGF46_004940 [Coemansia sp. RSA 552]